MSKAVLRPSLTRLHKFTSRLGWYLKIINGSAQIAITTAVQRGGSVYVYHERNQVSCTLPADSQSDDGLKGFKNSTVSIQRGAFIYVHDEKEGPVQTVPAQ